MNRLIVPPLPAASRPSKSSTCLPPVSWPVLELEQLDLQQVLLLFVDVAVHPFVVRVVLPPGVDRLPVGIDEDRVIVVVLAHRMTVDVKPVYVLPDIHEHGANAIPSE